MLSKVRAMDGNLHVRNLDDDISRLKRRAALHGLRPKPSIARFSDKPLSDVETSFDTLAAELRRLTNGENGRHRKFCFVKDATSGEHTGRGRQHSRQMGARGGFYGGGLALRQSQADRTRIAGRGMRVSIGVQNCTPDVVKCEMLRTGIRPAIGAENLIPEEVHHTKITVRVTVMNKVQFLLASEPREPLKARSLYVVFLVEKDVRVKRRRTCNYHHDKKVQRQ